MVKGWVYRGICEEGMIVELSYIETRVYKKEHGTKIGK
jgi:hypothetical protein